jgi:hypothetical protein
MLSVANLVGALTRNRGSWPVTFPVDVQFVLPLVGVVVMLVHGISIPP